MWNFGWTEVNWLHALYVWWFLINGRWLSVSNHLLTAIIHQMWANLTRWAHPCLQWWSPRMPRSWVISPRGQGSSPPQSGESGQRSTPPCSDQCPVMYISKPPDHVIHQFHYVHRGYILQYEKHHPVRQSYLYQYRPIPSRSLCKAAPHELNFRSQTWNLQDMFYKSMLFILHLTGLVRWGINNIDNQSRFRKRCASNVKFSSFTNAFHDKYSSVHLLHNIIYLKHEMIFSCRMISFDRLQTHTAHLIGEIKTLSVKSRCEWVM